MIWNNILRYYFTICSPEREISAETSFIYDGNSAGHNSMLKEIEGFEDFGDQLDEIEENNN